MKFLKLIDMVKQIVCIGVNDPAESKSGHIFELGILFHCLLALFVANFEKFSKLVGQIVGQIRPWQWRI